MYNSSLHVMHATRKAWTEVEDVALDEARTRASKEMSKAKAVRISGEIQEVARKSFKEKLQGVLTEKDQEKWNVDTIVQQKESDLFTLQDRIFDILLEASSK